jgi:hypothetical protein
MALPVKMEENERGIMALNGLTGGIIATVLLLSILAVLTMPAISVQQENAENYYEVNQDLNGLKMNSPENHKLWINK